MITPIDQPIDRLDNLTEEENKSLDDWEGLFSVFISVFYAHVSLNIPLWVHWLNLAGNLLLNSFHLVLVRPVLLAYLYR
jgi:hypothetical protein